MFKCQSICRDTFVGSSTCPACLSVRTVHQLFLKNRNAQCYPQLVPSPLQMHSLLSVFCSIPTVCLIAALHSSLENEVDHSSSLCIVMEATPFLWALLITIILSQAAEPMSFKQTNNKPYRLIRRMVKGKSGFIFSSSNIINGLYHSTLGQIMGKL